MKLDAAHLPAFTAFLHADLPPAEQQKKMADYAAAINNKNQPQWLLAPADGQATKTNSGQDLRGVILLQQDTPQSFLLRDVLIKDRAHITNILRGLLQEAIIEAQAAKALRLGYFLQEGENTLYETTVLAQCGFKLQQRRIEYQAPLSRLPDDVGTPLQWESVGDLSLEKLRGLADLLTLAAEGDPTHIFDENALTYLQKLAMDPEYPLSGKQIHLGKYKNETAAIVIAQTSTKPELQQAGLGRITYMGLLPNFRGLALGQWLQRHGFAMLRASGAKIYRGGTDARNTLMQSLFQRHGCDPRGITQNWLLKLS